MPSVFGEDAVVRVLDRAQIEAEGALTLDAQGFEPEARAQIRALARQPHGMLLVPAPPARTRRRRSTPSSAALSWLAGQRAAAIMNLIQTAKLNGHDPYTYLRNVLQRLPTQRASDIDELLRYVWAPPCIPRRQTMGV